MIHDPQLLDQLESIEPVTWAGNVFRVTLEGRDPLMSSNAGGRWCPRGEGDILYTSLEKSGAVAEVFYAFSLQTPFPTKRVFVHTLELDLEKTIEILDLPHLAEFGVDILNYQHSGYQRCQEIGAAAQFLGFDGLIVPNARFRCQNLVVFRRTHKPGLTFTVSESEPVVWEEWRDDLTGEPSLLDPDSFR